MMRDGAQKDSRARVAMTRSRPCHWPLEEPREEAFAGQRWIGKRRHHGEMGLRGVYGKAAEGRRGSSVAGAAASRAVAD